jgi:hypothetical protein
VNKTPATADPLDVPLPTRSRLAESLNETDGFDTSNPIIKSPTVLYLAYGSNLCHETFQGRRGIRPLGAVNVIVPELKLTFDLPGMPYNEPCFANSAYRVETEALSPQVKKGCPTVTVNESTPLLSEGRNRSLSLSLSTDSNTQPLIGVVYEVTSKDYAHIIATEGPTYADVVVVCHALPTKTNCPSNEYPAGSDIPDSPFKAHTLLAPTKYTRKSPSGLPAQPSLRYLTLCRDGAREHHLPDQWQEYLDSLQPYTLTTFRQKLGKGLFLMTVGPLLMTVFTLRNKLSKKRDGRGPKWLNWLVKALFKAVWTSYDFFWRPVFGEGERTYDT